MWYKPATDPSTVLVSSASGRYHVAADTGWSLKSTLEKMCERPVEKGQLKLGDFSFSITDSIKYC